MHGRLRSRRRRNFAHACTRPLREGLVHDPSFRNRNDLHHTDDLTPLLRDELAQWASFLQAWQAQQWVQAGALIRALAQQHPQQLLYALYQERVAARSALPFDPGWDGSTQFETK